MTDEASNGVDGGLLARLDQVESRLEILDLEGRYARTWDSGDGPGWADVFTEDGVFSLEGKGQRYEGRSELERMCHEFTAVVTGLHLFHLPEITVAAADATSRLHFEFRSVRRDAPDNTQQMSVTGYYDTTYRRTEAGWRMALRAEHAVSRSQITFHDL